MCCVMIEYSFLCSQCENASNCFVETLLTLFVVIVIDDYYLDKVNFVWTKRKARNWWPHTTNKYTANETATILNNEQTKNKKKEGKIIFLDSLDIELAEYLYPLCFYWLYFQRSQSIICHSLTVNETTDLNLFYSHSFRWFSFCASERCLLLLWGFCVVLLLIHRMVWFGGYC